MNDRYSMNYKIQSYLRQPFPFESPIKHLIFPLIGVGLFVSLFLVIFLPFDSARYIQEGRTWALLGYGVVTVLALMFDLLLLPRIFPGIFNESKWNVSRAILFQFWHIISIGTANIVYSFFFAGYDVNISAVLNFFLITLAIGFFPIIIGMLSIHFFLLQKYVKSTKNMNERLVLSDSQRKEEKEKYLSVVITSETGREEIEIDLDDLLFIKSIDNYVEVYRTGGSKIDTVLLRSTLKRIEENLKVYPFLFRCHRTYLVNVNNISRITGNSQGHKLIYDGVEDVIPVSRSCSKRLLNMIA